MQQMSASKFKINIKKFLSVVYENFKVFSKDTLTPVSFSSQKKKSWITLLEKKKIVEKKRRLIFRPNKTEFHFRLLKFFIVIWKAMFRCCFIFKKKKNHFSQLKQLVASESH